MEVPAKCEGEGIRVGSAIASPLTVGSFPQQKTIEEEDTVKQHLLVRHIHI